MLNPVYSLPELNFVGGGSQEFHFHLLTAGGTPFDATGCDVAFAIVPYVNKCATALLTKPATVSIGAEGVMNLATVHLESRDTAWMHGRYVYQLSVRDKDEEVEIPGQGILNIACNIHQSFINE